MVELMVTAARTLITRRLVFMCFICLFSKHTDLLRYIFSPLVLKVWGAFPPGGRLQQMYMRMNNLYSDNYCLKFGSFL